jgi:ParB-like chromosome segregation protein Spo0J
MKVENWKIERVKPYDKNPRKNDGAVDAVAKSLKEFGFRQPIVVDKDGVVIVGHTRLKAAKKLGMDTVPVHIADLDPVQAKAYRLIDNQTASIAEWDTSVLNLELGELKDLDFDLSVFGFDALEVPNFDPVGIEEQGRLDEKSPIKCPDCGFEFVPK